MSDGIRIDYDGSGVKAATAALERLEESGRQVGASREGDDGFRRVEQRLMGGLVCYVWTFDCPCGKSDDMAIGDEGEDVTCDECGRIYRLRVSFEVSES